MTDSTVLLNRARHLVRAWSLGVRSDKPFNEADERADVEVITDGPLAYLEHLIHEMAHARLLNIEWGPGMSDNIGRTLQRANDSQFPIEQEAKTWVAEWTALKYLGFGGDDGPITMMDVYDGASIQGCEPSLVDSLLDDDECVTVGTEIAEFLSPGCTE